MIQHCCGGLVQDLAVDKIKCRGLSQLFGHYIQSFPAFLPDKWCISVLKIRTFMDKLQLKLSKTENQYSM